MGQRLLKHYRHTQMLTCARTELRGTLADSESMTWATCWRRLADGIYYLCDRRKLDAKTWISESA